MRSPVTVQPWPQYLVHTLMVAIQTAYIVRTQGIQTEQVIIPPIITRSPAAEYILVLGQSFSLPCEASGSPTPTYRWLFTSNLSAPVSVVEDGVSSSGTLLFAEFQDNNEGFYECWAENVGGRTRTNLAHVRKAYLGTFRPQAPTVITSYVGQSRRLTCDKPDGLPTPILVWDVLREGSELAPLEMDGRIVQSIEGNLHLVTVLADDDGVIFSCKAKNAVIRNIISGPSYTIRTKTDPRFNQLSEASLWWHSTSFNIEKIGNNVKFQCIFYGNPSPDVIWERDQADLPVGRWFTVDGGTSLEIRSLQEEDTGTYMCVGYNDITTSHVYNKFMLKVQPEGPTLITKPQSVKTMEGSSVTFMCEASGATDVEYSWFINGTEPTTEYRKSRLKFTEHSLTIPDVSWSDTMSISCGASDEYGTTNASAYLGVERTAQPAVHDDSCRIHPASVILWALLLPELFIMLRT